MAQLVYDVTVRFCDRRSSSAAAPRSDGAGCASASCRTLPKAAKPPASVHDAMRVCISPTGDATIHFISDVRVSILHPRSGRSAGSLGRWTRLIGNVIASADRFYANPGGTAQSSSTNPCRRRRPEWFGELGYAVGHGPHLAPGEPAAERDSFGDVVLVGRLREAIRRLNPAIPEEAREEALRKVLRVGDAFAHADEPRLSPDAARRRAGGIPAARWQHRGRSCAAGGFRRRPTRTTGWR